MYIMEPNTETYFKYKYLKYKKKLQKLQKTKLGGNVIDIRNDKKQIINNEKLLIVKSSDVGTF